MMSGFNPFRKNLDGESVGPFRACPFQVVVQNPPFPIRHLHGVNTSANASKEQVLRQLQLHPQRNRRVLCRRIYLINLFSRPPSCRTATPGNLLYHPTRRRTTPLQTIRLPTLSILIHQPVTMKVTAAANLGGVEAQLSTIVLEDLLGLLHTKLHQMDRPPRPKQ